LGFEGHPNELWLITSIIRFKLDSWPRPAAYDGLSMSVPECANVGVGSDLPRGATEETVGEQV
jgi:hypothetical protein